MTELAPSTLPAMNPTVSRSLSIAANTTLDFAISTALDFSAVLQAAQSLSGPIPADGRLRLLTQIVLQISEGDRCALFFPDDQGNWQLQAIATDQAVEIVTAPLADYPRIPSALIQHVIETHHTIMLDPLHETLPIADRYLSEHSIQSLLCLPVLSQGNLVCVLYVQHQSSAGIFTSDHVSILSFLCSQAAISIENDRLYKRSQRALKKAKHSQQLLKKIIDTIPQVIFWKNREFVYLGCSPKFAAMAGVSTPEEICGKTDYDLSWSPAEAASFRAYDRKVMETNQAELHILEPLRQPDGTTLWLETSKVPLCDEQGHVYGVLGSFEDISDRKRAEEIILKKSEELEQTLADLKHAQLQMVKHEKMASLGNLVAGVAHEINNPIGFLNGSIENAQAYAKDLLTHLALYQQHYSQHSEKRSICEVDSIHAHAKEIDLDFLQEDFPALMNAMQAATDRITAISNSLRTFSRADTEYKVMADLTEGIESTLLILKYRLKASEARPAINVIQNHGDLPAIRCFPGQLNQVFMNLLANAIDVFDEAAQQKSFEELEDQAQTITITTTAFAEQNRVEIRIRDNGKGMDAAIKARIFDHLFTTKGVGKGTGLGLAIAHQIITEAHSGALKVTSKPNKGTEFCICLPIDATDTAQDVP
ncbi:MAG: hypothetical protein DCF15_16975 [Phormidesmis priestleyi]|uniref:histidine kinase n=1 Tax=Phormidesmis priestleyi TaxID=268141 RepID=A0A2W4YTA7_9CYAN|nr:MAG: hypothetical protein DCF15_16975 [Phormidesmis priestleyi]